MIECKLLPVVKNRYFKTNPPYKKYGHYARPYYSIKGLHQTCWIIITHILVDYEHYVEQGMTLEEIVTECIKFLNHRPKSRYGKKRKRKSLYGTFRPKPHLVKMLDKEGKKCLQVLLITEDKKNPNFWGEGEVINYSCRRERRK
tara:strand:- start:176 stop:607 length:432 start_codon:yes stop_codon:yes gene_type:complete